MNVSPFKFKAAALTGVASSLIGGLSLFVVFRASLELVSLAAVGCWALIQGLFLVARISDIGAGTNITRSIASESARGEIPHYWETVIAGLLISSLPVLLIGSCIVFPIAWYVSYQYADTVGFAEVFTLTLIALCVGCAGSIAAIIMAALEGAFHIASRNRIAIAGNLVSLLLAIPTIGFFGISGIGFVYLISPILQILAGLHVLRRIARRAKPAASRSIRETVRNLWSENLQLSAIALLRLSFEPVTKFTLSLIAPLPVIAAFELALRVATQARVTVQSAVQPLLAIGSQDGRTMSQQAVRHFSGAYQRLKLISLWIAALALAASPVISLAGIARFDPGFFVFFAILIFANTINALGLPGYYAILATGRLRQLVRIHIIMTTTNLVGCLGAAASDQPLLAVSSYGLTFVVGGIFCWAYTPSHPPLRKKYRLTGLPARGLRGRLGVTLLIGVTVLFSLVYVKYANTWSPAMLMSVCLGLTVPMSIFALLNVRRALTTVGEYL